jgi:RNA polymerase sigma-70 factor (ECF subfamily)
MSSPDPDPNATRTGDGRFTSTQWSLVLQAGDPTTGPARQALATLCQRYWYPLYAFVRRRTGSADRAEDLTQGFFGHLLQSGLLASADPGKGRFRAYLLACCKHYLANEHARANARKRGGGRDPLALDLTDADRRFRHEPADTLTPERLFERRWALTILEEALARLEGEFTSPGKRAQFERLRPALVLDPEAVPYARVAADLGVSEESVKKTVSRMRKRWSELVRERVADTVTDANQVDDEIRALFAALAD